MICQNIMYPAVFLIKLIIAATVTGVCGERKEENIPLGFWTAGGTVTVAYESPTTYNILTVVKSFASNGCETTSMRRVGPVNATCSNNSLLVLALVMDSPIDGSRITVSNPNVRWTTNFNVIINSKDITNSHC